jgi:multiple sugar transport system permease protein
MLPLAVWILMTMVYPLFYGIQLSLTNTRLIGTEGDYVGLDNYVRAFRDPEFHSALRRSINWTLGNALVQSVLGLTTGMLLHRARVARGAMRVWILLPWIVPTIAIAILWRWLLSATYGIVSYVLIELGLVEVGIPFLGTPDLAMMSSIFINSWRWFPFLAIVVLAGLLSIPPEECEAARMDGAGFWQETRFITFPYLAPTLTILGLIGMLWSFNMFDVIWLLTQGGPNSATRTLAIMVYEKGFRDLFQGRAAAIGVIMMLVLLGVLLVYFRLNRGTVALFAPADEEST